MAWINHRQTYQKQEKARSRKARRNDLEQSIIDGCSVYRREKKAFIDKVPEPSQIVKYIGNRKHIVRFGKEANNLFSGILSDGRMVSFCYAQTDQDRVGEDCVREKMVNRLGVLQENGAACFIIIGTPYNEYYRIPLWIWQNAKVKYNGHGIPKDDICSMKVSMDKGKALLFLAGW